MSTSLSIKPIEAHSTIPKGAISDDFSPEYFFWRERGREWDALWCPKDEEMGKTLNIIPHTSLNENSDSTIKLVKALLKRDGVTPKEKAILNSQLNSTLKSFSDLKSIIAYNEKEGAIRTNSIGDRNCRITSQISIFEKQFADLKKTVAGINQRFNQKDLKTSSQYPRTY